MRILVPAFTLALALAPTRAVAQDAPAPSSPAPPPPPPSPALDALRERFREGMDKYKAGAFADAIVIWESVYRDLGESKGYRLAFDLARAYEALGEPIKAAEHYETYLERVAARRAEGELLEAQVEKQEIDARDALAKIAALKGRIHVKAPAPEITVLVRVDNTSARVAGFTLYVEPGAHIVTFGSGPTADVRRVNVKRGEVLDVDPPAPAPLVITPPPETRYETHLERPFTPTVLWIGAGVALASVVVPVITYANALSIKSDYDDPKSTTADKTRLASDYSTARGNAYASIIVPALFTAAAGALGAWYILGAKETRTPITPRVGVGPSGAALDLSATF